MCLLPTTSARMPSVRTHPNTTKNLDARPWPKKANAAHPSEWFRFDLEAFHYHCCRSFDCSSLKTRDATKCHYGSKSFEAGDQLHTPEIEASCTIGCYCRGAEDDKSNAQFSCTHIDCPEFFGSSPDPPGKKCIRQYGDHSCCLKDTVCGEITRKLSGRRRSFIFVTIQGKIWINWPNVSTERSRTTKASASTRAEAATHVCAAKTGKTSRWRKTSIAIKSTAIWSFIITAGLAKAASRFITRPTTAARLAGAVLTIKPPSSPTSPAKPTTRSCRRCNAPSVSSKWMSATFCHRMKMQASAQRAAAKFRPSLTAFKPAIKLLAERTKPAFKILVNRKHFT